MHLTRLLPLSLLLLALTTSCKSSNDDTASSGPNPADSLRLVAQGTNTELKFKADHPGTLIVSNFTAGDYLYKGTLKAGDVFVLPPNSSRAKINKEFVNLDHDTNIHDEYRLYFLNK